MATWGGGKSLGEKKKKKEAGKVFFISREQQSAGSGGAAKTRAAVFSVSTFFQFNNTFSSAWPFSTRAHSGLGFLLLLVVARKGGAF